MNKAHLELIEKREKEMLGGGPEKIEKQHRNGKLTARERLDLLFDEGTFEEIGLFAKHRCHAFGMEKVHIPADGVVTGFGKVNGRTVFAYAQDFTSLGGSLGEIHGKKISRVIEEAVRAGAPVVGLNDSGGARIQESPDSIVFLNIFYNNTRASGNIPQISAIMGPCAGGAAYSPALTDFVINVDQTSKMFLTGPNVIKQVTGEDIDEETLGGARTHNFVSGVSHRLALNDEDCIEQIKIYLSYMPQNCLESPPVYECGDDPERLVYELDDILPENPNRAYDIRHILELICDEGSLYEIRPEWAKNSVTALARIQGMPVGFVANQPSVKAGCIDIDASDKMAHFINVCDAYNIPLVFVADCPGYLPGMKQEYGGIIRHGAKPVYAAANATVPRILLTIRKLYGGAAAPMSDYGMEPDAIIAWPTAQAAVMGASGAAAIVFRKEIANAEDPKAKLAEVTAQYEAIFNNPYEKAGRMYVDMVIEPNETRRVLVHLLETFKNKKIPVLPKKHGIMPV